MLVYSDVGVLTCVFVKHSNDVKSSDSSSINASFPRLSVIICSYVFFLLFTVFFLYLFFILFYYYFLQLL